MADPAKSTDGRCSRALPSLENILRHQEAPISGPGQFNHWDTRRDRRQPCERLTPHDLDRLKLFYRGLGFGARRQRFGGGLSDQAIVKHCDGIDWRRSIVVARSGKYFLQAVLELHPLSPAWDSAEIALACGSAGERLEVFAQLIQAAAFTAAAYGCVTFKIFIDTTFCEISPLLREMGRIHTGTDFATIDLREYAGVATDANCFASS
jgi:hypothetical protein